MVPPASHGVSRVPRYSGSCLLLSDFGYGTLTLSGSPSHVILLSYRQIMQSSTPKVLLPPVWPLSISLAATLEIDVSFSSSGYLDVSVHRVPLHTLWIGVWIHEVCSCGFPHSDIYGSKDICSSP